MRTLPLFSSVAHRPIGVVGAGRAAAPAGWSVCAAVATCVRWGAGGGSTACADEVGGALAAGGGGSEGTLAAGAGA